jgi:VPDSG-CTERM motif
MKTMKKKLAMIAAAIAFACSLSSNASALTINDPGVVGTVNGVSGDGGSLPAELVLAQNILDLATGVNDYQYAGDTAHYYDASNTNYSGTLSGGVAGSVQDLTVTGVDYVLAKYDGQSAGYVLFYVGGGTYTLPEFSYTIWGTDPGQYQISGYTSFTCTGCPPPPPVSVPDGGSTVTLLGTALFAFGMVARKFRKS